MNTAIGLKFDGKVIDELSTKIPSNIFALNELTKNSYDAFANNVQIILDNNKSQLIIKDDGLGMSEEDVKKLLHIASSTKKYGSKKIHNGIERYTQGSKGLGFLSVFKFGNKVVWETHKDGRKISFSIVKKELISKSNASRFKITPTITASKEVGTTISIDMSEIDMDSLCDYFRDQKNAAKTVNAFYDNSINIIIDSIHGRTISTSPDEFKNEAEDNQFCYVKYNSNDSKIKFYRHGNLSETVDFKLSSASFSVDLDLMIYHFKQGESKKKSRISKLFYKDPDESLSPLLFINNNLFNNYVIFDSNINRSKRSAESMPQMIGYVRVYSSNSGLDFNSDRTNFVENSLTKKIIEDLSELNRKIQKTASDIKKSEKDNTGNISTGKAYSEPTNDNNKKVTPTVAKINLKVGTARRHQIPSQQLNLNDFISSVIDSSGNLISTSEVIFEENGKPISNILSSINEECIREFHLIYNDSNTGSVIESLKIEFYSPKAIISGSSRRELFTLASNKSYSVRMAFVSNLLNQASEIYRNGKSDYYEIISCSLRAILEISIDHLKTEHPYIFTHIKSDNDEYRKDLLLWDVIQVIHCIKNNNKLLTEISNTLDISFHSLKNSLDIESYKIAVKKAHLGAHKAIAFLTPDDIKSLAQRAGFFAVFCDVMLYKVKSDVMAHLTITSIE
ncbi:ATP-binding protein [Aeromonas veronii]|uniref:ATP-binding protein n=1 Tax=Aeromonas veronii TaxID=654 RepID=UPI0031FCA90E